MNGVVPPSSGSGKSLGLIVLGVLVLVAIIAIIVIVTKTTCSVPSDNPCPPDPKTGEVLYPYCKDKLEMCGDVKTVCGSLPSGDPCPAGDQYYCKYDYDKKAYAWQCSSKSGGGGGDVLCKLETDGTLEYPIAYGQPGSYTITSSKKPVANSSKYIQITTAGDGKKGCYLSECNGSKYELSSNTNPMFCEGVDVDAECKYDDKNKKLPYPIIPGETHSHSDESDIEAAYWKIAYVYPDGDTRYCKFDKCKEGHINTDHVCKKTDCKGFAPSHGVHIDCKDGKWFVPECTDGYTPNKDKTACVATS